MARHGRAAVGHNWLVDSITAHRLAQLPDHLLGTPTTAITRASGIPEALMMESQAEEEEVEEEEEERERGRSIKE